ncbi:MAG TPA: PspC domain-containing protein [Bacteroidota bacterium]|nr:PspC domain-containing protein [Bacteroidota bacterium]
MAQTKRLYRSTKNKILAGICGGIAEYLDTDPTFVRIIWIVLTLLGGSGIILYIIAYLIMPENPEKTGEVQTETNSKANIFLGSLLIILGGLLLLDTTDVISFHRLWATSWEYILPLTFILIGFALLLGRKRRQTPPKETSAEVLEGDATAPPQEATAEEEEPERLMRSRKDKKILGVCGGIAEYFHIDSTIIRLLYILFTFATGGVGIIVYFLLALVMPKEPAAPEQ